VPDEVDLVESTTPVPSFVSVIVAPDTIAPVESVAVPVIPPVSICADSGLTPNVSRQNILVRRTIRLSIPASGRREKDQLSLPSFSIGSLQKCFNAGSWPFFALTRALVRGLPGVYTGEFSLHRTAFPIVYKRVKVDKSTQMRSLRTIPLLYLLLFNV
jgi:hypothetical protein